MTTLVPGLVPGLGLMLVLTLASALNFLGGRSVELELSESMSDFKCNIEPLHNSECVPSYYPLDSRFKLANCPR